METSDTGKEFLCTCVYVSNYQVERKRFWSELIQNNVQFASSEVPRIVMGNFSEILSSTEHSTTSRTRNQSGMIAFQDTVAACSLTDLPSLGLMFTWINNQSENHVAKKLDRVLVNDAWMNQFSQSYAKFEPSGISDHTRSRVFLESEPVGRKLPFKFFNFLADHPDFLASVSDTWNQTEPIYHSRSALYIFSKKLKLLKPILRHLNKTKFGDIPRKTKEAFQNLCEKQAQALSDPSSSSFDAVSAATENWNHWAVIEEHFYLQKSRINWLKFSDQNIIFFHKIVQSRTTFNVIRRLVLLSGEIITDPQAIKVEQGIPSTSSSTRMWHLLMRIMQRTLRT